MVSGTRMRYVPSSLGLFDLPHAGELCLVRRREAPMPGSEDIGEKVLVRWSSGRESVVYSCDLREVDDVPGLFDRAPEDAIERAADDPDAFADVLEGRERLP